MIILQFKLKDPKKYPFFIKKIHDLYKICQNLSKFVKICQILYKKNN